MKVSFSMVWDSDFDSHTEFILGSTLKRSVCMSAPKRLLISLLIFFTWLVWCIHVMKWICACWLTTLHCICNIIRTEQNIILFTYTFNIIVRMLNTVGCENLCTVDFLFKGVVLYFHEDTSWYISVWYYINWYAIVKQIPHLAFYILRILGDIDNDLLLWFSV